MKAGDVEDLTVCCGSKLPGMIDLLDHDHRTA